MRARRMMRLMIVAVSLTISVSTLSLAAPEEKYPKKSIMFVSPWAPESETIVMARMITEEMAKILGQRITLSSVPGGSGAKAFNQVLSQPSDGYTLLDGWVAPLIVVPAYRADAGYSYKDFIPIGHVSLQPWTLVVRNDSPWKTLDDLVKHARANPGLKYQASGAITVPAAVIATFLKEAGIKASGVPYEGMWGGIPDLLGGTLDFSIGNFYLQQVHGEKIRTLCVFLSERHPWFPDLPTAKELGYDPGFGDDGMGWNSFIVKKGTPDYAVKKLEAAFKQVVTSEDMKARMKKLNFWLVYKNPEETLKLWERSHNFYKEAIKILTEKK